MVGGIMIIQWVYYKKKKIKFLSIGIAYDQQFCSYLPTENFDITLDIIITQSKVISR